jgi:hypothetical protein
MENVELEKVLMMENNDRYRKACIELERELNNKPSIIGEACFYIFLSILIRYFFGSISISGVLDILFAAALTLFICRYNYNRWVERLSLIIRIANAEGHRRRRHSDEFRIRMENSWSRRKDSIND